MNAHSRARALAAWRCAGGLIAGLMLATFSGCADLGIEPWVKPYERNQLADPIMSWDRNPLNNAFVSHVRQSREGARGAEGGGGGGCGCN